MRVYIGATRGGNRTFLLYKEIYISPQSLTITYHNTGVLQKVLINLRVLNSYIHSAPYRKPDVTSQRNLLIYEHKY